MLKRISFIVLVFALIVARPDNSGASPSPILSISGNRMIVIMPARQRILQLGFDLLTLRPRLVLISYQGTSDDDDLTMHLWNGDTWLPLSEQDYEAGRFLKADVRVEQVYLIGPEAHVPWVLQYRPLWADDMHWVQSLHIPDIVNVMGERFRFTRQEWQRMATWHDLRLYETTVRYRHVQREETWRETSPDEARRPLLERLGGSHAKSPARPTADPVRIERQPWTEVPVQPSPPDVMPDAMPEDRPAATDTSTDPMPGDIDIDPPDDATPTIPDSEPEPVAPAEAEPAPPIDIDDEPRHEEATTPPTTIGDEPETTVTVIDRIPDATDQTPESPRPADPAPLEAAPMAPPLDERIEAPLPAEPATPEADPPAPAAVPETDTLAPEAVEDDAEAIAEPADAAPADVTDDSLDLEKGMDPVQPPVETGNSEPIQPAAGDNADDDVDDADTSGTQDLTPEEVEFFRLIREEFPDLDDLPDLP